VLTPSIKTEHEVLYYNKLPFSEDIRQYAFAPLLTNTTRKSYVPSEEQLNAAEELINSLDLMKAATDEDGYVSLPVIRKFFFINPRGVRYDLLLKICYPPIFLIKKWHYMSCWTDMSNVVSNPMEALKPKYTYNPALQHFYQVLQTRAMQPETPLPPLDPLIEKQVLFLSSFDCQAQTYDTISAVKQITCHIFDDTY